MSPLHADGSPHEEADASPGVCVLRAARRKRRDVYPEFDVSSRCHLIVLGFEVGGRWSEESRAFLPSLAHHRAQRVPEHLRASTLQSTLARWSGMLSVAAQSASAATLLELPPAEFAGDAPDLHEVFADFRLNMLTS